MSVFVYVIMCTWLSVHVSILSSGFQCVIMYVSRHSSLLYVSSGLCVMHVSNTVPVCVPWLG